jgi:hypothetical protein
VGGFASIPGPERGRLCASIKVAAAALAVFFLVLAAPPARAAAVKYTASGAVQAQYSSNVYFSSDTPSSTIGTPAEDRKSKTSSLGGSLAAELGANVNTPRSQFVFSYRPYYRYYYQATRANNLSHGLNLTWKPQITPNTSMKFSGAGSYSPESDNFQERGVDQAFTAAPRARQTRGSVLALFLTQVGPRGSITAEYSYRLLNNGRTQARTQALQDQELRLFDEETHAVGFGAGYQTSQFSKISGRVGYLVMSVEENLFGSAAERTRSFTGDATYSWSKPQRWDLSASLGAFRSRRDASTQVLGLEDRNGDGLTLDLHAGRMFTSGTVSFGVSRSLSTFEGISYQQNVTPSQAAEAANVEGAVTAQTNSIPLGSATRTTAYIGFSKESIRGSSFTCALNGTRRDGIGGGATIDSFGLGSSYGARIARWGGILVSANYVRQRTHQASDQLRLAASDFTNYRAMLGFFFAKR